MMIKGHCQQLYNLVGYPGQGGAYIITVPNMKSTWLLRTSSKLLSFALLVSHE